MADVKEGYMIYIGENTDNYLLSGNLIKYETYYVKIISSITFDHPIYNIYQMLHLGDDFTDYIGVNNTNIDVSNDFITLAEWREQQIKEVLDE